MGTVFTPGLTVSADHIVQRDRRLPLEGEVLVAVGDRVAADDLVARTELPGKVYPLNVANELGIDPARLPAAMLHAEGATVERGELLARTKGVFGLFSSESHAPVSGTVESISTVTGSVILQEHPIPVEVDAYIGGKVVEVIPREGCVVQAAATLVQGIFGLGGETRGEIVAAVGRRSEVLDADALSAEHRGRIVIGGAYVTLAALERAREIGVAGVVVGGFDYDEIKEILGYEVGVAITGGEDLGLTLMVTEGFGRIDMAPATFQLLRDHEGRRASLNGATQIRAGVIRPEVVVTHDREAVPDERVAAPEPEGIAVGDTVRGIRAPYFGRIGTVRALPVEAVALASETRARVLEIAFEDGSSALIPRTNVESIEA
ncbi:MAG: hypothetical protein R3190_02050 [Thermoanaerobaculia bacterium]|nr:hypothetical protein [Thermoanaerobaculia bacterium]